MQRGPLISSSGRVMPLNSVFPHTRLAAGSRSALVAPGVTGTEYGRLGSGVRPRF